MDKGRFVCQTISAHVCDRLLNRDCFRSLQTSLSLSIHFPQSDSVSELEKVHGYRDERLDFIQQAIRKFCLNCIQTPSSVSLSLSLCVILSPTLSLPLSLPHHTNHVRSKPINYTQRVQHTKRGLQPATHSAPSKDHTTIHEGDSHLEQVSFSRFTTATASNLSDSQEVRVSSCVHG